MRGRFLKPGFEIGFVRIMLAFKGEKSSGVRFYYRSKTLDEELYPA